MIIYTWVGDDGIVRWSDELPDDGARVKVRAAGVVDKDESYTCLIRYRDCVHHAPDLDMALALVYWDDVN